METQQKKYLTTHYSWMTHIWPVDWLALVQIMACHLFDNKTLFLLEKKSDLLPIGPLGTNFIDI